MRSAGRVGGRGVRVFHIVLGAKWTAKITEIRTDGTQFDLVVFTGDLGDWGAPPTTRTRWHSETDLRGA